MWSIENDNNDASILIQSWHIITNNFKPVFNWPLSYLIGDLLYTEKIYNVPPSCNFSKLSFQLKPDIYMLWASLIPRKCFREICMWAFIIRVHEQLIWYTKSFRITRSRYTQECDFFFFNFLHFLNRDSPLLFEILYFHPVKIACGEVCQASL